MTPRMRKPAQPQSILDMTIQAAVFDFDGTLAPNLDLADMRQQIVNLTVKAGVPSNIYESLYICSYYLSFFFHLYKSERNYMNYFLSLLF